MRAVLAYRFQRKTQAELALKSAVFGDFRPHTPDKEHSPLTLIKFDSRLLKHTGEFFIMFFIKITIFDNLFTNYTKKF